LEPYQRRKYGFSERVGDLVSPLPGREQSQERKAETQEDKHGVSAGIAAV
jgi:hypothetical protein